MQPTVDGPAKSCTKRMVETCGNPIQNGINYRFQLVTTGFRWPVHRISDLESRKCRKSSHTKNSKAVQKNMVSMKMISVPKSVDPVYPSGRYPMSEYKVFIGVYIPMTDHDSISHFHGSGYLKNRPSSSTIKFVWLRFQHRGPRAQYPNLLKRKSHSWNHEHNPMVIVHDISIKSNSIPLNPIQFRGLRCSF